MHSSTGTKYDLGNLKFLGSNLPNSQYCIKKAIFILTTKNKWIYLIYITVGQYEFLSSATQSLFTTMKMILISFHLQILGLVVNCILSYVSLKKNLYINLVHTLGISRYANWLLVYYISSFFILRDLKIMQVSGKLKKKKNHL